MTPAKPTISRAHIIKSILGLIDLAERPGWWGEVGIAIVIQDGRLETIKKKTEQTDKTKEEE